MRLGDEHHRLPAVDDIDLLADDEVDRLLEAGPDDAELALLLLIDQEVDDRLELLVGHVVGIGDLGEALLLEIERGLLAGGGVIVLKRDIALPLRIEERGIGIELAGLLRQIGEGIALQHGRHAIDLVVVADELEARLALAEELIDIGVLGPVRQPAVSIFSIRSFSTSGFCMPPTMLMTS